MRIVTTFAVRRLVAVVSCVVLYLLVCNVAWAGAPQSGEWKRYTVNDEEFSLTFPSLPSMTSRQIRKLGESATHWERTIGAYGDGVVYVIFTYENRSRLRLEEFVEERRKKAGGRRWDASAGREITFNGFAGREFDLNYSGVVGLTKFFQTKNHLYQIEAVGAEATDLRVTRFFESLTLGPKADGQKLTDGPGLPADTPAVATPEVFSPKDVDRKIAIVSKPTPTYTETARQNKTTGTIVLKALFSDRGVISETQVISDLPNGLTERAIYAAKLIKYVPAMKEGRFVSVWLQLEYNFNLY